jgi:hypothetical protein
MTLSPNTEPGSIFSATEPTRTESLLLNCSGLPITNPFNCPLPLNTEIVAPSSVIGTLVIIGPTFSTPVLTIVPRNKKPATATTTTSATQMTKIIGSRFFI